MPKINSEDCIKCGMCADYCMFNAIEFDAEKDCYKINPDMCDECGACLDAGCPAEAIE